MDETDTDRGLDRTGDEVPRRAVRRIDGRDWSGDGGSGGSSGPFDAELTPAVRRVGGASTPTAASTGRATGASAGSGGDGQTIADETPDIDALVGPRRTLEPRIQVVWILQSALSAALLGAIAGVAFSLLEVGGAWVGGVVFTALFLLGVVFAVLRYRVWRYEVREDSLYLHRGVVTRVTTVVPYVRIQHVDVRRGAIERTFGLATTVVYTAGSRGADVSIPGLTPERAADLQTRLKHLAIAAEGEDAV